MANKQKINRATERVGLAADEAARDGDERGIHVAFDGAVENHLLMPEVAAKLKRDYLTRIDEYQAKTYILNNPSGAVDYIEEKGKDGQYVNLPRLTPDQRLTLINTARGPVVDEEALAWALQQHLLAAAALDVYENEPAVHPDLLQLETVLLVPHLGSGTTETRRAMASLAVDNVVEVLSGRPPLTPVGG